jgi:hypothetical protein
MAKDLSKMTVAELEIEQARLAEERGALDERAREIKAALDLQLEAQRTAAILGVDVSKLDPAERELLVKLRAKQGDGLGFTNMLTVEQEQ